MKKYTISREVNAPISKAWEIVGNPAKYHEFAPTIGDVEMLSETRRKCFDENLRHSWEEDMVKLIEGKKYSMKVDTGSMRDNEGNPVGYPLKSMQGTWEVEKIDEDTTKIIMSFDYEMKYGILGSLLHVLLRVPKTFQKMCEPIMENYSKEILDNN